MRRIKTTSWNRIERVNGTTVFIGDCRTWPVQAEPFTPGAAPLFRWLLPWEPPVLTPVAAAVRGIGRALP